MNALGLRLGGFVRGCVSGRRLIVILTVTGLAVLALSASASALLVFPFDGKIEPPGSPQFAAGAVAVNDFNSDTYVAVSITGVVEIFNPAGVEIGSLNSSLTPAKSFGGGFSGPFQVNSISVAANNATGEVYVVDPVHNVIDAFNATGEYQCQITGSSTPSVTECNGLAGSATPAGKFTRPGGITVDQATGRIYVIDGNNKAIDVFSPAGAYLSQISLASVPYGIVGELMRSITVDDSNGSVYLAGRAAAIQGLGAEVAVVYEFNASGAYVATFTGSNTPAGHFIGAISVASDNASGNVYITSREFTYVFDASGAYLTEFSHEDNGPTDTAVDQASGKIYVSNIITSINIFGPSITLPDVTTGSASEIKLHSVTLNGTVNPDNAGSATCEFVWGTTTAFGHSTPCSKAVANGNSPVAVQATVSGLQANTLYYYRLQATNTHGTNPGEPSQNRQVTTSGPAAVESESVSDVASGSATLDATIAIHNAPTSYYFQYGTTAAYGTDAPVSPGALVGSGERSVEVSQHVQLPTPGTLYHYRVVTVSELELSPGVFEASETDGPDMTLNTQPVLGGGSVLPDGRRWEMVSPPQKGGAQIFAIGQYSNEGGVIQASASGNAIAYVTDAPTEGYPQGYTNLLQVFSARGSNGWGSTDISVPHNGATGISVGYGAEYRLFSEDLSLGLVQPFGKFLASLSSEASEQTAFLRKDYGPAGAPEPCTSSCYRPLVTGAPGFANVPAGTVFGEEVEGKCKSAEGELVCGPHFVGGTPDLSHVVLMSNVALTGTPAERGSLYVWGDGSLAPASQLPGASGKVVAAYLGRGGGQYALHAVSDDGSRVFWAAVGGSVAGDLFMRDVPRGETILIRERKGTPAEFEAASSDGSKVFFNDEECEVKVSKATGGLECPVIATDGKVVGISKDGSWVYFVAGAVLAPGAVPGGENVYVRHAGTTRFIATVSAEDVRSVREGDVTRLTWRVSPNGRWLAFMSARELAGQSTRDALTGSPDEEVYLYDAEAGGGSGRLVCASCNPTGARPVGVEYAGDTLWSAGGQPGSSVAATIPGGTPYTLATSIYQSRVLSDSGRLFFNSNDGLAPQDVNGTWDVYEYESPGIGGCGTASPSFSERSGGCVGLISSGESGEESGFLDASENGSDVFFLTSAKLSVQDRDTALDIYDAHECSAGVPCFATPPTVPPACETGDSCKPAPSPQPEGFGAPASATFAGAGNVSPPVSKPAVVAKGLTRAQKLARALKACRRIKSATRRTACTKQAKARYAARKAAANASKRGGR